MPKSFGKPIKMNLAKMSVIVLDSIASLNTPTYLESEVGKQNMALLARFLSVELKKLTPGIATSNVAFIGINQVRSDLSATMSYGNPESSPGGKALKHACSVMAEVRPMRGADNEIKSDFDDVLCRRVKVEVSKNKMSPPTSDGEYWIRFDQGIINQEEQLLEAGKRSGYIEMPTSRSYVLDGKKHTSKDKILTALSENIEQHVENIRNFYLNKDTAPTDVLAVDDAPSNPFEDDGEE
jgi:recombination protein RecA